MRLTLMLAIFALGCGSSSPPAGGPTLPGGACTASTTAVCQGACQVCLLAHDDMGIEFDNGHCAELCTYPGGACAAGKTCTILMDVPSHGGDYNDSGDCDFTKTAVCL